MEQFIRSNEGSTENVWPRGGTFEFLEACWIRQPSETLHISCWKSLHPFNQLALLLEIGVRCMYCVIEVRSHNGEIRWPEN